MSKTGIVKIDGKEIVVEVKQLAYVTVPSTPSIPDLQTRLEALLIGGSEKGVESTRAMLGGGIMIVLRLNSSDEACDQLTELLNNSVSESSKARRERRRSSLGMH